MPDFSARSAVVLCVDGLGVSCLGPYGNTWVETPALNHFAAQSLLMESVIADAPFGNRSWGGICGSMWTGRHPLCPVASPTEGLFEQCHAQGVATLVVTDDAELADQAVSGGCQQVRRIAPADSRRQTRDVSETQLATFLAESLDALATHPSPSCAWLHSRALLDSWDAPHAYVTEFLDEEDDPLPPNSVPCEGWLAHDRPDAVWETAVRFAAQVRVLDECLGVFVNAVDNLLGRSPTLLMLTSPRAYPLGENGFVGFSHARPLSCLLQVPLLVRVADEALAGLRLQELCQPSSVRETLAGWLGLPTSKFRGGVDLTKLAIGNAVTLPACLAITAQGEAIRTRRWLQAVQRDDDCERIELFAKPDDRWDTNEVSQLCSRESLELRDQAARFRAAAADDAFERLLAADSSP